MRMLLWGSRCIGQGAPDFLFPCSTYSARGSGVSWSTVVRGLQILSKNPDIVLGDPVGHGGRSSSLTPGIRLFPPLFAMRVLELLLGCSRRPSDIYRAEPSLQSNIQYSVRLQNAPYRNTPVHGNLRTLPMPARWLNQEILLLLSSRRPPMLQKRMVAASQMWNNSEKAHPKPAHAAV
jgi:hypothetical protein